MRLWLVQIVAAVVMTILGAFVALVMNLEMPPRYGETTALVTVAIANLLWLVPSIIYILKKQHGQGLNRSVVLFLLLWLPFLFLKLYSPGFNSAEWKTSLNPNYMAHDGTPAHRAGSMVASILTSDTLIGKSLPEIDSILGPEHFQEPLYGDSCYFYLYSNWNPFDWCDKLAIKMRDGVCIGASYFGCD